MKIYTKTGDRGDTGLFGGARVSKASQRVAAYGTVDELNAAIGVARATGVDAEIDAVLASVQVELFSLGAELATVPGKEDALGIKLLSVEQIHGLEHAIDASEARLEPLKNFVLPAGDRGAAALHMARTVCRRAEREIVALRGVEPVRDETIVYLNRMSDLLFSLARWQNKASGHGDVPWQAR